MDIKNEVEGRVKEAVALLKKEQAGRTGCWCRLCETDITALALTLLPPLYCRSATYGYSTGLTTGTKIQDAVRAAARRVALRPKHRPGAASVLRDDPTLVNYAWEVGTEMVGQALGREAKACRCEGCRSDALAYALNRYPAKYGVVQGGRRSLHETYLEFMRHELMSLISQAASVVAAHPHH